jgi:hypothetical protein
LNGDVNGAHTKHLCLFFTSACDVRLHTRESDFGWLCCTTGFCQC